MRVLIGCEESQAVCKEFRKLGIEAYSNDIMDCSGGHPEWHLKMDIFKAINLMKWDALISFPPCTFLTVAGNRHIPSNPQRWEQRLDALKFVYKIMQSPIRCISVENPVGVISSYIRKPDQIFHPYHFGDPVPKKTCLWLKNLPELKHTKIVEPEYIIYKSASNKSGYSKYSIFGKMGKGHGKERSVTFPGVAKAMAEQWGEYLLELESVL